jgi:hypothetical protein
MLQVTECASLDGRKKASRGRHGKCYASGMESALLDYMLVKLFVVAIVCFVLGLMGYFR